VQDLLDSITKNKKAVLILSVLIFFFSLFFFRSIMLQTADLGRYLVNGREILSGNWQALVTTNFYSYTYPDYPFINHHWFFGVIAYSIQQAFGFAGLSLFGVVTTTTAFGALVYWSYKRYGLVPAVTAGFLMIPLITTRHEIRPELISLLGVTIYFIVLERFTHSRLKWYWLWIPLFLTQLVWQNTHLFFILGLFELFVFWLYAVASKNWHASKHLGALGVVSAGLTLLNPNTVTGALMPFTIFKEYGYRVAENQSWLFMLNYFHYHIQMYELFIAVLLVLVGGFVLIKTAQKKRLFLLTLATISLTFGIVTFKVNRLASFWGVLSIPLVAELVAYFAHTYNKKFRALFDDSLGMMFLSSVGFIALIALAWTGLFMPFAANTGIGLAPGVNQVAEFIKKQHLQGPVFNNYDIGGYLIYHLYPEEKVFVDNRPEAYPTEFFENEYIGPQNDSKQWRELDKKYDFNLIVFYRHDLTEWAQKFMIDRVSDENWVPIYVDNYSIIFIKNVPENADVISIFELPQSMFGIK